MLWHDPGGTTLPTRLLDFQTMPKRRKEQGQTAANADRVVNVRTGFRTRLDLIQQTNIPSCVVVKSDESTLAETFQSRSGASLVTLYAAFTAQLPGGSFEAP